MGHNLAQKMMYPYNLESAFRNLLIVSTVKGAGGKFSFGLNGPF